MVVGVGLELRIDAVAMCVSVISGEIETIFAAGVVEAIVVFVVTSKTWIDQGRGVVVEVEGWVLNSRTSSRTICVCTIRLKGGVFSMVSVCIET
jgi:hypothetical protein